MRDRRGRRWSIEDLDVFKRAYQLSLELHRVSLDFPKIEQFGGLADQLRRALKSVCSLIAEGAGRQQASPREFARYLTMAIGSAEETRLWCSYCSDLGYVKGDRVTGWRDECHQIIRMLQGLKSSVDGD
jgi:four helix bundle protein